VDIQTLFYNSSAGMCVTVDIQTRFYNGSAGRCVTVDIQTLFFNGSTGRFVTVANAICRKVYIFNLYCVSIKSIIKSTST
jgi:hypothetical protein